MVAVDGDESGDAHAEVASDRLRRHCPDMGRVVGLALGLDELEQQVLLGLAGGERGQQAGTFHRRLRPLGLGLIEEQVREVDMLAHQG